MSQPLPPAAGSPMAAAVAPVAGVAPTAAAAATAPAQAAVPVAPASSALRLSAQAQQALRLQVFQTLIAQLVTQVQSGSPATAPQWPTNGVPTALREMLATLIAQATAGLPQPQQLVAAQPWPQAWLNAVMPAPVPAAASAPASAAAPASATAAAPAPASATAAAPALATAAAPASTSASALAAASLSAVELAPTLTRASAPAPLPLAGSLGAGPGAAADPAAAPTGTAAGAAATASVAPRLPPLQTWLVQQGVVQAPDGERGFALTLQVPQAWAQMQAAAVPSAAAAPAASGAATPFAAAPTQLQLPFAAPAQQLESGALALVLQGAGPGGEKMRTSALLWLDFQPLPATAGAQSATAALAGLLPSAQMAQQALATLQARNDPWLQMAALQASGQQPRDDQRMEERRTGMCTELGCPYLGKASCAQPFCAEMTRVWAAVRVGAA